MKLLPPADPSILLRWDLLCQPFKLNGAWTAALRRPKQ